MRVFFREFYKEKVEQEVVKIEVENVNELDDKTEEKGEFDDDKREEDKFEVARDAIGVKYLEIERSMCVFRECYIYSGSSSV